MADSITATLQGLGPVLRRMRNLAPKIQQRGLKRAVRKGATVVQAAAQQGAMKIDDQQTARNIAKNIAVQYSSPQSRREGGAVYRVGVLGGARSQSRDAVKSRRKRERAGIASLEQLGELAGAGAGNPGGDTWYWRLHEFGTSKMGARPFMQPALANNTERVTSVVAVELEKAVDRALK
jgi:HK97 gp10 family phage protein